jgi:hypothetical protein
MNVNMMNFDVQMEYVSQKNFGLMVSIINLNKNLSSHRSFRQVTLFVWIGVMSYQLFLQSRVHSIQMH